MQGHIQLREVLSKLQGGTPCDIVCVTYNRSAKSGGSLLELKGAVSSTASSVAGTKGSKTKAAADASGKDWEPNHQFWGTLNLRLPNDEVRKIHTHLIISCNGKEVIW